MPEPTRDLNALRRDYKQHSFDETTAHKDPLEQFHRWFDEAVSLELPEPNAFALATVDASHRPSVRTVLLKDYDQRGLSFFTNYESRKGQHLAGNPNAGAVFLWHELERQVRIEAAVEKVPEEESDAYFALRPRSAQLGAWASAQSTVVANRAALETNFKEVADRFGDGPIPRPPHWGGYRLLPRSWEFWQGRPSRMHDRVVYLPQGSEWRKVRWSP